MTDDQRPKPMRLAARCRWPGCRAALDLDGSKTRPYISIFEASNESLNATKYLVDVWESAASNKKELKMPPTKSLTLTEAELRLMDVLWEKGPATVQQVLEALPQKPALAYNSVLTTIRILETKGYLKHVKDGRAHVYRPVVQKEEATRSEISHLAQRFFKNSHELLALNILQEEGIDEEELGRLRQLLADQARRKP